MSKDRNFTGCWACRFKKRRCDERKPSCSLCLKHGVECSYDVRLSWLSENMHVVKHGMLQVLNPGSERRMSKRRFTEVTDLKCGNFREETACFTISARRFKVYDNSRGSVHDCGLGRKTYDAEHVDAKLSHFLDGLEHSTESGPFTKFPVSAINVVRDRKNTVQAEDLLQQFWKSHDHLLRSNWCLADPDYLEWFKARVQKIVKEWPSPSKLAISGSQDENWIRTLNGVEFYTEYAAVMLFLSAKDIPSYWRELIHWFYMQWQVRAIAFPLIVELCHRFPTNVDLMLHLIALLEHYRPISYIDGNTSKILFARIETILTSDRTLNLKSSTADDSTAIEMKNVDLITELEVM